MSDGVEGSCLCGAVRFRVTGRTTGIGMCHCSKCRKVSGVASNAELMVGRDGLVWLSGEDAVRRFELPSGWRTAFCATCGSPLPKPHPSGGAWWVPAGLLDGDPGVRVGIHVFVDSRAPWDEIGGPAPQLREGFDSEPVGGSAPR